MCLHSRSQSFLRCWSWWRATVSAALAALQRTDLTAQLLYPVLQRLPGQHVLALHQPPLLATPQPLSASDLLEVT